MMVALTTISFFWVSNWHLNLDMQDSSVSFVEKPLCERLLNLGLQASWWELWMSDNSASDHEIECFFDHLHDIELSLSEMVGLKHIVAYMYVFSVKKCGKTDCSMCSLLQKSSSNYIICLGSTCGFKQSEHNTILLALWALGVKGIPWPFFPWSDIKLG